MGLVFEDEVCKISIEASRAILQLTWKQQPSSMDYRRGYQQAIRITLEHQVKYWITDARQVAYLHRTDQHWMYANMLPLLMGGKLLKFALVLQPETFLMTDRQPVLNYQEENAVKGQPFMMDFFLDLETAQFWLLKSEEQM